LAHAILLAADAPAEAVAGRAFFVNDAEALTWADFCAPLARAAGVDPAEIQSAPPHPEGRTIADRLGDVRSSAAVQALLPLFPGRLKRSVKAGLAAWKMAEAGPDDRVPGCVAPPAPAVDRELFGLQRCGWRFSNAAAEERLGFRPPLPFAEGMRRAVEWWLWAETFREPGR
jgi:nucleoside-diphosphate-sugar epimerase